MEGPYCLLPMPPTNVDLLRRAGRRLLEDPDSLYRLLAEDAEWDETEVRPDVPVARGVDAVRELFRDMLRTLDEYGYEWEEMIDAGEQDGPAVMGPWPRQWRPRREPNRAAVGL